MTQQRGWKSVLLLGLEATYAGTVSSYRQMPIQSFSLMSSFDEASSEIIRGVRDAVKPARGLTSVQGSITAPLDGGDATALWLQAMFGAPTAGVYALGDSQPSLALEDQMADISSYRKFVGVKISKASLAVAKDTKEIMLKLDVLGASETASGTSVGSGTATTLSKFYGRHAAVSIGGSASSVCQEFSLDIDFGLDGDSYALNGTSIRTDIPEGMVAITGSITLMATAITQYAAAIAQDTTSLGLTLNNGVKTLTIAMPMVSFGAPTADVDGPKGRLIKLPYTAWYDSVTAGQSMTVTLGTVGG